MNPGAPPPPLPPPATTTVLFGKYRLGRFLGLGSFAKVYQAKSLADDSEVAIKIINKSKAIDESMADRILREVAAMRRLQDHPNIIKIHEVMASKAKIYIVMEYAPGGDLENARCNRRGFRVSDVSKYFSQLVSALNFCHKNGIYHRDVKPQNLLLDRNGNLKVSDFGLTALPEQLKNGLLHTMCGTPAFIAPEVVMQQAYRGAKADAWSCGVMLFYFLTGTLPFDCHNQALMLHRMRRKEYEFPPNPNVSISKQAKNIIGKLLDPNPITRLSLQKLMETQFYKRLLPESSPEKETTMLHGRKLKQEKLCSGLLAFEILSLSSGMDLSGLFEGSKRKEKRYTSMSSVEEVVERVREVGEKLGYKLESGKRGVLGLGKGKLVLVVEVVEVAAAFLLVEIMVAEGGPEFKEEQWTELEAELGDIVVSWQ